MDTARFCFMLLCVCGSWSLDLNCDWTTEYRHENRCCKACPSGHYPKVPCTRSKNDSTCVKCSTPELKKPEDECFCKDNHLCSNDKCKNCNPRIKCLPGQQLIRYGNFQYTYICEPCPDDTYNDAEDSTCKSITKCGGGGEIFHGNKTHNARCASTVIPEKFTTDHPGDQGTQNNGIHIPHSFMVACLAVTVLTFLALITYTGFKICTYKMNTKLSKTLCTHRIALPSDTCSCKLSKEEEGAENDSTAFF